ncbi:putative transcriptional regulatory protein EmbR [Mycobacterium tuberculosis H37Rv] [Mycobacterium shimoidei]|uniref:Putative transcriptional regulatory protein EmbR [Mycobacterium tuberculosis H37Rv] n=1 Tax=Mycobacterium shimoidei TaxID=29313 RepID=A0A375Z515_MYCSH|nr:BTAD domain-containing putative transcriptional regulator [Mycobacterium shimoidei]SRX96176.1 putative transcriptional regulatory protein EmbR [Mycobacterium tuberculosis H37Rv] [Mycobacterium shimoidei]
MGESGLDFGVLGPLQLSANGTPVALGAPKQRAVLAMLVLNRNRPVGVEELIDAVWDESPIPAARATIQSYVSNLRRVLCSAGYDGRSLLASAPPGYRLNIADPDCDLGRFIAAKTAGVNAAAAGRFEQASRHLADALAEWRGPVLEDLRDFAFVERWTPALTEDKLLAYTAFAEAEIACGRAYGIIGELEKLTTENPYREPLWQQLITAYYDAKRQSDALDAYQRLKATLADELGIDPNPAVNALYERILRQEPLDTKRAAQTSAVKTIATSAVPMAQPRQDAVAELCDTAGRRYPLESADTRIGRLADNDIVLGDQEISRHHAVIIDTGTKFMIIDLRSANGVEVRGQRIAASADLSDGDRIRIGHHEFVFHVRPR